jgi:hypothetical protein
MEIKEFPILKYTVQLYYSPRKSSKLSVDGSPPVQIASGILIKNASKFYLLTCKHVFDNINTYDVIVFIGGGLAARLPNKAEFIDNENESIDLTLIQLKGERVRGLKSCYDFLPRINLGFDHIFDEELHYMLFGFINKRTSLQGIAFHSQPFAFLTGIRCYKKIEKMGFSYTNNVTLEYNRRKQGNFEDDSSSFGFKDLKGLSGGGVWLSVEGKKPDTFEYLLVGVLIEERIERGFVIATKVDLIRNFL